MRPEDRRPGQRAGSQRKVRRLLTTRLGWLRGGPRGAAAAGSLPWRRSPWTGVGGAEDLVLTRTDLGRAVTTARKLEAQFPRALPAIVGDVTEWREAIEAQVQRIQRLVDGTSDGTDEVDELLRASKARRERAPAAGLLRTHPVLRECVVTCLWRVDPTASPDPSLRVLRDHAQTFADLVSEAPPETGVSLAMELLELVCAGPEDEGLAIVRALAHPGAFTVPLAGVFDREYWPRMPAGEDLARLFPRDAAGELLGPALQDLPGLFLGRPARVRRLLVRLLGQQLAGTLIDEWRSFHGDSPVLLTRCAASQPLDLDPLLEALPPRFPVRRLASALAELARADVRLLEALVNVLGDVPLRIDGHLPRPAYLLAWTRFPEEAAGERLAKIRSTERLLAVAPDRRAWFMEFDQALDPYRKEWLSSRRWDLRETIAALEGCWKSGTDGLRALRSTDLAMLERCRQGTGKVAQAASLLRYMLAQDASCSEGLDGWATVAAASLSRGDGETFVELARLLEDRDLDFREELALTNAGREPALAPVLTRSILDGDLSRALDLAHLVETFRELGGQVRAPVRFRRGGSKVDWWKRYPEELHARLRELDQEARNAPRQAARSLAGVLPDVDRIEREITGLEARLARAQEPRRSHMAQRLDRLRQRRGQERCLTPRKCEQVGHVLERRIHRSRLERWIASLRIHLGPRILARLGEGVRLVEDDPRVAELLPHLAALPRRSREGAMQGLMRRLGPEPLDFRELPGNARFLESLRDQGIDPDPWLEGLEGLEERELEGDDRRFSLALAHDPVDVFYMGAPFLTCLSPGDMNFFSTVANALDVNKRVLFARDAEGNVQGRCLLALTDEGRLLTFHAYAHDRSLGFAEHVARYASDLARAMGTIVVPEGSVSSPLGLAWYDDGPMDLTGRLRFLEADSAFSVALGTMPPGEVLARVAEELGQQPLDDVVLQRLVTHPAVGSAPQLALELVSVVLEAGAPTTRLRLARLLLDTGEESHARELYRSVASRPAVRSLEWEVEDEIYPLALAFDPARVQRIVRWQLDQDRGRTRLEDDDNAIRLFHLAEAMIRLHRPRRAQEFFRLALARRPGPEMKAACRERLDELAQQGFGR